MIFIRIIKIIHPILLPIAVLIDSNDLNAKMRCRSALAQLVEQMTVNHWVAGSSPAGGAKLRRAAQGAAFFYAQCVVLSLPKYLVISATQENN